MGEQVGELALRELGTDVCAMSGLFEEMRVGVTAAARKLMADVDDAGRKVDVRPAQPEHLGEAHPRVCPGEKQRPISARASGEETDELPRGEDALVGAKWVRPLVALEPVEGMGGDVTATEREREDTTERGEDPLDRPGRETLRLQLARDCDDIVGADQRQPAIAESRQQVAMELRAVEIERPVAPFTGRRLGLELGEPAARDLGECEPG